MTLVNPIHPGKYLKEAFMKPLNINNQMLADAINVTPATVSRLVNGKSEMSIEMAIKLSKAFGNSAQQWLNLQQSFSLSHLTVDTSKIKQFKSGRKILTEDQLDLLK